MEMIVKFQGTEGLEKAILQLAQAIAGNNNIVKAPDPVSHTQQPVIPQQAPITYQNALPQYAAVPQQAYQQPVSAQYQAPAQTSVPVQSSVQVQQPVTPPVVPTSHTAQTYTQDQIAVAMTALCDAGKIDIVMGILSQFGAETLMQVPKDQYPALVTLMRGAGANI